MIKQMENIPEDFIVEEVARIYGNRVWDENWKKYTFNEKYDIYKVACCFPPLTAHLGKEKLEPCCPNYSEVVLKGYLIKNGILYFSRCEKCKTIHWGICPR